MTFLCTRAILFSCNLVHSCNFDPFLHLSYNILAGMRVFVSVALRGVFVRGAQNLLISENKSLNLKLLFQAIEKTYFKYYS